MKVSKSNLVAILLEVGEENAAVLLARSDLPDEIDLQRDLDFLTALGLDPDQVDEVAQLTIGRPSPVPFPASLVVRIKSNICVNSSRLPVTDTPFMCATGLAPLTPRE